MRLRKVPVPWRDAAVVVVVTAAAATLSAWFDVSETLRAWTAPWESLQLDELPGVLLVLALGLAWFAARRYRDAGRELRRRRAAEESAATALAANRRLAQQYVKLQESERKTLAQELHDELGQYLNVIKLDAVRMRDAKADRGEGLRSGAEAIIENCDHIHHALAALIRRLRPVGLDELGLEAALEHCAAGWRARLPATQLHLAVTGDLSQLSEAGSLTVYRLVQEALTNVAKHATARNVHIELAHRSSAGRAPQSLQVTITDDGVGVELDAPTSGLGLIGMRERVTALDGTLEVASSPGAGFRLRASLPLAPAFPA
ncbi:MAG TPA: sensor histidine kinase [Steroidobacteraceae bacterium]|nr:sensor histidine kinase [Steroidobacteraceae bacterium]